MVMERKVMARSRATPLLYRDLLKGQEMKLAGNVVQRMSLVVTIGLCFGVSLLGKSEPASRPRTRRDPTRGPLLATTRPNVSPSDQAKMTKVFHEAVYLFMCGDFEKAYRMVDSAIDTNGPTQDWYLYLALYRRCFEIMTGTAADAHSHSGKGTNYIRWLKGLKDPSATQLVKLAVLLPMGPDPVSVEPQLTALIKKYPGSPWSPWARWHLLMDRAARIDRQVARSRFTGQVGHVLVARRISLAIRRAPRLSKEDIMLKWMIRRLGGSSERCLFNVKRNFESLKRVRAVLDREGATDEAPVLRVEKKGVLPATMRVDLRLLHVIDGSYHHPRITCQEAVWTFFENLKKAKVVLPEMIPQDKDVFMAKTKEFLSRLRSCKPWDLVPSGPDYGHGVPAF